MAVVKAQAGGLLAITEIYRANFFLYSSHSQIGMFGADYKIITLSSVPSLGTLAFALQSLVDAYLATITASDISILGCKVNARQGAPKPLPGIATSTTTGAASGATLPTQTSGIISTVTSYSGRAYRGRMFIPFPATAMQGTNGEPSSTYVTDLGLIGTALCSTVSFTDSTGSGTAQPVIWHKGISSYTPIASYYARNRWATQRRRGDYGRLNAGLIPI